MSAEILVAEDSPTQAEELRSLLERAGFRATVARSGEQALERIGSARFDLLLSDVVMPGISGYELCRRVKQDFGDLPVVLLTSLVDPMDIVRGLQAGADNYITKPYDPEHLLARLRRVLDNRRVRSGARTTLGVNITFLSNTFTITSEKEQILDLLLSSVEDTVRINHELEVRQRELADAHARLEMYATAQAREVRRSMGRYESLMQHAGDAIFVTNREGTVIEANARAARLLGRPLDGLVQRPLREVLGPEMARAVAGAAPGGDEREPTTTEPTLLRRADGREVWVELSTSVIRLEDETLALVIARDVTERRHAEEQIRQAQRLEAVGRLSGGIAHDFNNILTTIQGSAELLLEDVPTGTPIRDEIEEIEKAARRGTGLTRQLLAFSRKQVLQPKVLEVNALIEEMHGMLRRLIRDDIDLRLELDPRSGRVRADAAQMQQVVMNLVVNARDAMPAGGVLTLRTQVSDAASCGPPEGAPGRCVAVVVSDTGEGMSAEVRERIFEPFFTSKPERRGTGLGLSTVHGIVTQSGGAIEVESEPGAGSTFRVLLPRVDEALDAPSAKVAPPPVAERDGLETLLLVEDDDAVRRVACRILKRHGYTVLEAASGGEALELLRVSGDSIDLLVTDLIMPAMSGVELAARVLERAPDLPVLYMSGYTEEVIAKELQRPGTLILEKPFTPDSLALRVREALSHESPPS